MIAPTIDWRELRRISGLMGAVLLVFSGLALMIQATWSQALPPVSGYQQTEAIVTNKEQKGTFQDPAFSLTLAYSVAESAEEIRSGRRVPFEAYYALAEGATITINYNQNDPFEWRLVDDYGATSPNETVLGLLMVVFGMFSLAFPLIVRVASREADFEYKEEMKTTS